MGTAGEPGCVDVRDGQKAPAIPAWFNGCESGGLL